MVAFCATLILADYSVITAQTAEYILGFLGAFIGIRTVDRFAEKWGDVDTGTK